MRLPWLVWLLLAATGCGSKAESAKITITGASTSAPLVARIAKRFEAPRPGVRIDVQLGGSSRGVADVRNGMAQIGMISRAPREDEKDLTVIPLARDAICIILHKDNPLSALADAQVGDIYLGKVTNWDRLGGRDEPMTVVHKAEGRGTLEVFLHYYKLSGEAVKATVVIGDNEQAIKTVQGLPGATGYVSIGTAQVAAARGVPIKLVGLGGVAPTAARVEDGTYPATRTLDFVVKGNPQGVVKEFIDYATSSRVHDLVRAETFVPIKK